MEQNMENKTNEPELLEQNVRVLSPGMMVMKRFFRNRLAIAGLVIITCMFLFSFVGGAISPYSESQIFYTTEEMRKDYAGATEIDDYHVYKKEGVELPSDINSKITLAIVKDELTFKSKDGNVYGLSKYTDNSYGLYKLESLNADVEMGENIGVVCQLSFTPYSADITLPYEFYQNVLLALRNNITSCTVGDVTYQLEVEDNGASINVLTQDGAEYVYICNMNINSVVDGVYLTPDYKMQLQDAIADGKDSFDYVKEDGTTETYTIDNKNGQYTIKRYQETRIIDIYAAPSEEHWLGTDANGMDILTRLMYGGRISLMIGFVVVFIELFIGVIVGGIAGFFGGWVDNLLMRFVDVVYCIPAMPLYLILGSVMDYYDVSATARIYLLCVIMAIIGWVGIARIVRGQILSLREQEFMIAAEATGLSVYRRIFKHLVPNVIPQLIVFASMGLGDIILSEAALSFLGLGVKFPAASWGSIINAVNDSYVMTNYLWVWVPAGMLILFTVLAFNFIGDGLRDAFDPKMKR